MKYAATVLLVKEANVNTKKRKGVKIPASTYQLVCFSDIVSSLNTQNEL